MESVWLKRRPSTYKDISISPQEKVPRSKQQIAHSKRIQEAHAKEGMWYY